jgi:hypothetical protein
MPITNQRAEGQESQMMQISRESIKKLEDLSGQWMILEEHWTKNNLDRRQQLDYARDLYKRIRAEILNAYKACPDYSDPIQA